MKLKITKETNERIEFTLDCTTGFANALRRTILAQLPSWAINEVTFYENTSPMFNEYISNRIGLIPLTWEDSKAHEIDFSLNAEGPCVVKAGELKSQDSKIKVYNEDIPIIKLPAGRKLRFEAKAVKGIGRTHAKFKNALCSYNLDGKTFHFFIESYNNLKAKEVLEMALEILKEKYKEIHDNL
ncbi:DNA-directed RNA polymerase subunit D [uncultured archaeon]|nr:DNA-directed RNA polymerase subunit D [uncultured archaeon]